MTCPIIKQNESGVDRSIRIIIGLVALFVAYSNLSGVLQIVIYLVGVVALLTGISGFCGLYALFGISTNKKAE